MKDRAMMTRLTQLMAATATALLVAAAPMAPGPAQAQNLFAPVITINGRAITTYELQQRQAFLQVLRVPGNLAREAEEALINERIQAQAAEAAGITLTAEQVETGMAEFAARAGLETEAFVAAIGQQGVSPETFRDFVTAGLLWREYVQARFSGPARVTDAEVARALEQAAQETSVRVRLAELVVPTDPQRLQRSMDLIEQVTSTGQNFDDFSLIARRFSVAPSRMQGGLRDWVDLSEIPATLAETLLTLSPGQVTDPVPVGENVVAIFQLRGISESGPRPAANVELDYITIAIPGGRTPEAEAIAARYRDEANGQCAKLFPQVRGANEDALTRAQAAPRSLPNDLSLAFADMDPGETTTVTRNNGAVLLFAMLCNRAPVLEGDEARQRAQLGLFNARLTSLANGHLEELKAKAFIERK